MKKEPKPPKYKIDQMVYSYQNKTKKASINYVRRSYDIDQPHQYRLTLPEGRHSNWISEKSIYLTKK